MDDMTAHEAFNSVLERLLEATRENCRLAGERMTEVEMGQQKDRLLIDGSKAVTEMRARSVEMFDDLQKVVGTAWSVVHLSPSSFPAHGDEKETPAMIAMRKLEGVILSLRIKYDDLDT